ncbi:MAG: glutaredoxin family protein [Acidobacteria bacterium]|nr:glutaredoxin family protein [Acidobacteriota bacterium]
MLRLTLYTRPGCHLCDAMKSVVDAVARNEPVALRQIDITGNGDLERRFGVEIPVLEHEGQVLARVRPAPAARREERPYNPPRGH